MWMVALVHSLFRLIVFCFVRSQQPSFALGMSRIEREAKQLHFGLLAGILGFLSAFCLIDAGLGFLRATPTTHYYAIAPPPTVPLFWGILFAVMTRGALNQRAQYTGIVDLVPGIDLDEDGEPHHRPLKPEPVSPILEPDRPDLDVTRRVLTTMASDRQHKPGDADIALQELPTDKDR